jgi:hypothetical protein
VNFNFVTLAVLVYSSVLSQPHIRSLALSGSQHLCAGPGHFVRALGAPAQVLDSRTLLFRWRFDATLRSPVRLKFKPYTGTTTYRLNDAGLVAEHYETWCAAPRLSVRSPSCNNEGQAGPDHAAGAGQGHLGGRRVHLCLLPQLWRAARPAGGAHAAVTALLLACLAPHPAWLPGTSAPWMRGVLRPRMA